MITTENKTKQKNTMMTFSSYQLVSQILEFEGKW